jgi:hypothetical protein
VHSGPRLLVACVGMAFLGDDAFGSAVSARLSERVLPDAVEVAEFGIRGLDLVYSLGEGYEAAIFLAGGGLDPLRVLDLARAMGPAPRRVAVVACAPQAPLQEAAERVVERVETLAEELAGELGPVNGYRGFRVNSMGIRQPWRRVSPTYSSSW